MPRALAFLGDHGNDKAVVSGDHGVMAGRRSVRAAVARDLRALGPGISGSAEAVAALKVAALLDDGAEPPQVPNLTRELRLLMAAVRSAVPAPDADDPMEELRALAADIP